MTQDTSRIFRLSVYNAHKLLWSPTLRKKREGWGTRSFLSTLESKTL